MESTHNFENSPSNKALQNAKYAHNLFKNESPFQVLPSISTPPSRTTKIKNPFEAFLIDELHTHLMSPTVFMKSHTPNQTLSSGKKFKWTIEEISLVKPADIDESSLHQCQSEHDNVMESYVQEKIDKFFSLNEILPSPCTKQINTKLISDTISPVPIKEMLKKDTASQTMLSLPLILPEKLEELLKPYFNQDENDGASTLYKTLFEFGKDCESIESSPAKSIILSPVHCTPIISRCKKANFDLSIDCDLSPLSLNSEDISHDIKRAMQLDFSGYHYNEENAKVPDTLNINNEIDDLDNSTNDIETLSNTSVNWDIEYKQVQNICSPSSKNEIDVTNTNTPRSKLFSSQRKKLSDSFLMEYEDEEDKENQALSKDNRFLSGNDIDGGYSSNTGTFFEDTTWSASLVSASTPTKLRVNN